MSDSLTDLENRFVFAAQKADSYITNPGEVSKVRAFDQAYTAANAAWHKGELTVELVQAVEDVLEALMQ